MVISVTPGQDSPTCEIYTRIYLHGLTDGNSIKVTDSSEDVINVINAALTESS